GHALIARAAVAGALAGYAARGTAVLAARRDHERPRVRMAAAAHVDLAVHDGDVAAGRGHVELPAGADRAAVAAEEVDGRRTDGVDQYVAAGGERHRSASPFLAAGADLALLDDLDAAGGDVDVAGAGVEIRRAARTARAPRRVGRVDGPRPRHRAGGGDGHTAPTRRRTPADATGEKDRGGPEPPRVGPAAAPPA